VTQQIFVYLCLLQNVHFGKSFLSVSLHVGIDSHKYLPCNHLSAHHSFGRPLISQKGYLLLYIGTGSIYTLVSHYFDFFIQFTKQPICILYRDISNAEMRLKKKKN